MLEKEAKKLKRRKKMIKPRQSIESSPSRKTIFILLLLSFTARLIFFIPVAIAQVPPMYDEARYYGRAEGFSEVLKSILLGQKPSKERLDQAYGDAVWPPLHPLLMSFGMLAFGNSVNAARIIILLFSTFTVLIVYALAQRFVSRKASLFTALIYIFYPSFIAYGHYLWPETIYIFFLLLTIYFTVRCAEAKQGYRQYLFTAATGIFLGLTALTRSAAMPYFVLIPIWLFFKIDGWRKKIIVPALLIAAFIIAILPWQNALVKTEKRFVFLSNTNGFYFYYGNNKWFSDEAVHSMKNGISLMPTVKITALVSKSITRYSREHSIDVVKAGSELSKKEIFNDFPDFVKRCFYRLRMFASSDVYITRSIFRCIYPPLPRIIALLLWIIIVLSFIAIAGLILFGFITAWEKISHIWLLLLLLSFGLAPLLLVNADSRYALPLVALALPAAGCCCENFGGLRKFAWRQAVTWFLFLLVALNTLLIPKISYPSAYYAGLINPYDRLLGFKTEYIDYISIKPGLDKTGQVMNIKSLNPEYKLSTTGMTELPWTILRAKKGITLDICSVNPKGELQLDIMDQQNANDMLKPLSRSFWRRWQRPKIPGTRISWDGSGYPIHDQVFIENYVKLTTDIVPAITAEAVSRGKGNRVILVDLNYGQLSDDLQHLFRLSYAKFKEYKDRYVFSIFVNSLKDDDIIILSRRSYNRIITDKSGIPEKGIDFVFIPLIQTEQKSSTPVRRPAAVMIFNRHSDLFKTLQALNVEMRDLKPLIERIKWDEKNVYKFLQNLHLFLFGCRLDEKSVSELANRIQKGSITRKDAYNLLVKDALTLYY